MITTVEKVLFLRSIDLFRGLPGEELARIAEIAEEIPMDLGAIVFHEGETGDALYIVVEGRVRVTESGRVLADLGERECFGEMAVLDAEPRSATVAAVTDVLLLRLGREDLQEILSERPEIALGIMKVLSQRLREANRSA